MTADALELSKADAIVGVNPDHRSAPLSRRSLLSREAVRVIYPWDSGARNRFQPSAMLATTGGTQNPARASL